MSFRERSSWIVVAGLVLGYGWYLVEVVRDRTGGGDPWLVVAMVVGLVALVAVGHAVLAATTRGTGGERSGVTRRGRASGGIVLAVGAVATLVLAVLQAPHLWIAHVTLASLVLSEVVAHVVGIAHARTGAVVAR